MDQCWNFNNFCYVCGKRTIMPSRRKISEETKTLYSQYFNGLDVIENVDWAPSIICTGCLSKLNQWKKTGSAMPFGIPMVWTNPVVHIRENCYACLHFQWGMNRKKSDSLTYHETHILCSDANTTF